MLGSYFEDKVLSPINGLGSSESTQEAARILARFAPATVRYTVWANQTGETNFQDNEEGQDFLIAPVSPGVLAKVQAEAGGHPISLVGFLFNRPVSLKTARELFDGTPYQFLKSQVLYRQDDPKPVPVPVCIVWGLVRDHDDLQASYQTLSNSAARFRGILVAGYGAAPLLTHRARPGLSAEQAITLRPLQRPELYVYSPTSARAAEAEKVVVKAAKGIGPVNAPSPMRPPRVTSASNNVLAERRVALQKKSLGEDAPPSDAKVVIMGVALGVLGFVIARRVVEGYA